MKTLDDILMAHTGVESGERGGSPRELDLNRVPPAAMRRNDAWRSPVTPHLRHVQRIDALGRDLGRRVLGNPRTAYPVPRASCAPRGACTGHDISHRTYGNGRT